MGTRLEQRPLGHPEYSQHWNGQGDSAIGRGQNCEVVAIASRHPDRAREAAEQLRIPNWYGTYEELLASDEIDAVYVRCRMTCTPSGP